MKIGAFKDSALDSEQVGRRSCRDFRNQRGYSLIEVMALTAVISILLIPIYNSFSRISDYRSRTIHISNFRNCLSEMTEELLSSDSLEEGREIGYFKIGEKDFRFEREISIFQEKPLDSHISNRLRIYNIKIIADGELLEEFQLSKLE